MTIKFNGYDFGKKFVISDVMRPLPEFRVASTPVTGADGEVLDDSTVGSRECSFVLAARADSRVELHKLARELAGALLVREAKHLIFTDEKSPKNEKVQLVRLALPNGAFDFDEFVRAGKWTCRFKQPDPYLISAALSSKVIDKPSSNGLYVASIDVGGNAPANLTVTSTPPSGKAFYRIGAKGRSHVSYYAPFDGKHMLTINFKQQTVRVSKTQEDAPTLGGEGLTSASRFFEFSGSNLTIVASAPTTLKWYERWL